MAGASMKDIKLRIKSVESTMQITKAMQLVATSKLRRAKERMENSKPYTRISQEALAAAVASCEDVTVPFVSPREVKRRCYVVIAGDRGLAGGYNANIFKALAAQTHELMQQRFPDMDCRLHVSRIYRDARRLFGRGPYKDHLW